mmetsp:Transcript_6747/g.9849  ORF Transcript_6747/g.9849 Transcript_6747/m.9849 type:complete len:96 (+) Transcript_6747:169-456(+)
MIFNNFIPKNVAEKRSSDRIKETKETGGCLLVSLKPYQAFSGANVVPANGRYNQWTCTCRKTRVRTYCVCSPGFIRCNLCFVDHCMDVENEKVYH